LSLQAGAGYRLRASDQLSCSLSLQAGVQQTRFEVLANGVDNVEARYNPLLGLSLDGWWLVSARFGFWAAADVQTIGRESLLFVAPGRATLTSPLLTPSGAVGVGWWLP
jgi:hypothetical protein